MEIHQPIKEKYHGDYEEGSTSTEEGKTNRSIYMFHESEKGRYSLLVSRLNLDSLSADIVAKREQDFVVRRGYAEYDSKIYAVGGEYAKGKGSGQLLDVNVFDLSTGLWEKGPSLGGGKPNPVVVVVKGKIYALAGNNLYKDPPYSPSTILFETLAPSTGNSELGWIKLPDPPFSHLYPQFGHQVIHFYTVSDETIFFLLKKCWGYGVMLFSFDVDEMEWTDHTKHTGGTDPMPENIKEYHWVPMSSDIFDDILYMCYATTDTPGVKFISLDLLETQIPPQKLKNNEADYNLSATNVGDKLFWSVDFHRLGVNSLLPCLVIPLKVRPTRDPQFLVLVSHVEDTKFVVVCSYYTKHKIGQGKRVVYSCLFELVGESTLSEGIQFPSSHAVILKQKYQKMSSQLNVLSAWSKMGVREEKVEKDEISNEKITEEVKETQENVSNITEEVKETQKDDNISETQETSTISPVEVTNQGANISEAEETSTISPVEVTNQGANISEAEETSTISPVEVTNQGSETTATSMRVGNLEPSRYLAGVGVVTVVAALAVAYSFYKRSG